MGVTFAEYFVPFVSSQKQLPVAAIAKIERNPDQSKHLETARTKVLDTELDFVNLRSEEYAEDSRIPTEVVSTHFIKSWLHQRASTLAIIGIWYPTARCFAERHNYQRSLLQCSLTFR